MRKERIVRGQKVGVKFTFMILVANDIERLQSPSWAVTGKMTTSDLSMTLLLSVFVSLEERTSAWITQQGQTGWECHDGSHTR